jgi:N-methylhydantoinase A
VAGLKALNAGLKILKKRGADWLKGERETRGTYAWFADLRYDGQNFELILELESDSLNERALMKLTEAFHVRHKDYYGYDLRGHAVEIVNLRLVVKGERRALPQARVKLARTSLRHAVLDKRKVWFPETGYVTAPVYDRDQLPADCRMTGPAIIEQMDTTTVVPPKATLTQDRYGYLHMTLKPPATRGSAA